MPWKDQFTYSSNALTENGDKCNATRFGKASEALKMAVSDSLGGSIASAANLEKHLLIYMLQ